MLIPERVTDDTVEIKSFCAIEIKDAERGEVEAIVATLGVVDKDEDIIRADAIPDGAKVSMSAYGHDAVYGNAPVGKGKIHIEGSKAVFKGRVFLSTASGRDTFEVLKEMGSDQEWSFGFRILGAEVPSEAERKMGARRILTKLNAFEVSPVIIGAGVGTRTTGVKAAMSMDASVTAVAKACAAACRACAESCDKMVAGDGSMSDCMAACETCTEACDTCMESMGGTGTAPKFAVGARVVALANHMAGMAGMAGAVAEAHAGAPPYYAVDFDEPMGNGNPHKWLTEDELKAGEAKKSAPTPAELAAKMAASLNAAMDRRFAGGLPGRGVR